METEQCALQDKNLSGVAIRTILAANHGTSRKVYNSRWEGLASWYGESRHNPVSTYVKHVLDLLQLKSDTLAVNSWKGYVTAI